MKEEKSTDSNKIEINSVAEYIEKVNDLLQEEDSGTLFFRGQENKDWPVLPSIFRDNLLSIEHELLSEPLIKVPYDFKSMEKIEILAKYQHYGLSTRLLDVTTNPLVALYFACKENAKDEECGRVYFRQDYPISQDDKKVKIILSLAEKELKNENSLKQILSKLYKEGIITKEDKEVYSEENSDFPNIIQNCYTILPPLTNERMKMQSGAFLLSTCFNFQRATAWDESKISKGQTDLRKEFKDEYFSIAGSVQNQILEELNLYNINEATLFPELEHQLNYIKINLSKKCSSVNSFERYIEKPFEKDNLQQEPLIIELSDTDIKAVLKKNRIENELLKILLSKILDITSLVDWYNKNSIKSQFVIETTRLLIKNEYERKVAKQISQNIWNDLLQFHNRERGKNNIFSGNNL